MFISQYSVTREYGGPEEGGWWYDDFTFERVVCMVEEKNATLVVQALNEQQRRRDKENGFPNRYSAAAVGSDIEYHLEDEPREMQTIKRPRYE